MKATRIMRVLVFAVIALAVAACASIGRPEGGPKDENPPEFVRSNPEPGTKNFNKDRIDIYFDENIKLEDPSNKFVVSPAQQQMPQISANGKRLTVILRDTLLPDQTYTLDFSDAIRDLNEGNILDGFVVDFSTGDSIDSLRISGMVLQASNLEPAQGMIVGAYRNFADSAISTLRVERLCKTNQYGQFTLRNLKSEYYRLFALNDLNRDFHWDRSEDVAFYNTPVKPWAEEIEVVDTLRAQDGTDSISTRQGIRYLPNDILLTWFNENYTPLYMKDHSRNERNKIYLEFSAQVDTLPLLKVVNGENEGRMINDFSVVKHSIKNDTLEYWLTDSSLIMQDSLLIETRYLKTDSNEMITWTTDTIRYFFRLSRAAEKALENQQKEKEKKENRRQEAIKKWKETGDSSLIADTIPEPEPIEFLDIKSLSGSNQDYHKPVRISFSEPIKTLDKNAVHLEWMEDSIWKKFDSVELKQDSTGNIMEYIIDRPWEFETSYRLTIDSASVYSIYDKWNEGFKQEFKVKSAEEYSTIIFDIPSKAYFPEKPYNWDSLRVLLNPMPDSLSVSSYLNDSIFEVGHEVVDSLDYASLKNREGDIVINPSAEGLISGGGGESVENELDSLSQETNVEEIVDELILSDSIGTAVNLSGDSIDSKADTLIGVAHQASDNASLPLIIVELLSNNESVVARAPVVNGKARFDFITPGTYYARAFIDFNGNGIWDTGSINDWTQPEDVYYYPKKINLKKNWDMAQTWDLYELPLDLQKPFDIKKNKPKTKEARPTNEDEEEDEDGFGSNYFYDGNSYGNGAKYNNATRNNSSGFGGMGTATNRVR